MLYEAELFVESERVLVEVLGRIRPEDRHRVLPPVLAADAPVPLAEAVERYLRDDAELVHGLGRPCSADTVEEVSRQACAAPAYAQGGPMEDGVRAVRGQLLRPAVARPLLAHYVATAAQFEENMSTHYGKMIHEDDRTIMFASPEDVAEYLGRDLPIKGQTS